MSRADLPRALVRLGVPVAVHWCGCRWCRAPWYVVHDRDIEAARRRLRPLEHWELEQHLRELGIPAPARRPTRAATSTGAPARPRRRKIGRVVELKLLAAMMADPKCRERARREVQPEMLDLPECRELFRMFLGWDGWTVNYPPGASPRTRRLWVALWHRVQLPPSAGWDGDRDRAPTEWAELYGPARWFLEGRAEYRALEHATDPEERRRRQEEFAQRYPGLAAFIVGQTSDGGET